MIESTIPELNLEVEHVADLANVYGASARTALPATRGAGSRDSDALPDEPWPRAGAAEALRSFLEPISLFTGLRFAQP